MERNGVPARQGRVGRHDHAMDEIRYFVMSLEQPAVVAAAVVERRAF